MSSHCRHSIWTNRTSSSSHWKPAWIYWAEGPFIFNDKLYSSNYQGQCVIYNKSIPGRLIQYPCDCQHTTYASVLCLLQDMAQTSSQCATLSFGHLNVWGSKIICIYITHILISYGFLQPSGLYGVYVHSSSHRHPFTLILWHQKTNWIRSLKVNSAVVSCRGQPQAVAESGFFPACFRQALRRSFCTSSCASADLRGNESI